MQIKNFSVFVSILTFSIIGLINSYSSNKINHQSKIVDNIKKTAENIKFEDIFTPIEEIESTIKSDILIEKTK